MWTVFQVNTAFDSRLRQLALYQKAKVPTLLQPRKLRDFSKMLPEGRVRIFGFWYYS
jgi:hypothetical protein